jgi:hypothetical protein
MSVTAVHLANPPLVHDIWHELGDEAALAEVQSALVGLPQTAWICTVVAHTNGGGDGGGGEGGGGEGGGLGGGDGGALAAGK